MPRPTTIECPICFTSMTLKAPLPPGKRIKCKECGSIIGGEEPTSAVREDEEEEEPLPQSRASAGRSSGRKKSKSKSKPFPWVALIVTVFVVTFLAGTIGSLIIFREQIAALFRSGVDLAYCQPSVPDITIDLRIAEILRAPEFASQAGTSESLKKASEEVRSMLGIELSDVESLRLSSSMSNPFIGFGGPPRMNDAVVTFTSLKPITKPTTLAFTHEGIDCYHTTTGGGVPRDPTQPHILFLAKPKVAVLGTESTVRRILTDWNQGKPKPVVLPRGSGAFNMWMHDSLVKNGLSQASVNPMLAMNPDPTMRNAITALQGRVATVSLSARVNPIALEVSIQGNTSDDGQQIHTQLEALRVKALETIDMLTKMRAAGGSQEVPAIASARQSLSTPFRLDGKRVVIPITVPNDASNQFIDNLFRSLPGVTPTSRISGTPPTPTSSSSPGATTSTP